MKKTPLKLCMAASVVAIGLGVSIAPSEAATLSNDNTQIFGLEINSQLYDVTFEDGSYAQVFTNTGRTPTFLNNLLGAVSAAQAIAEFLNQTPGNEIIPGAFFAPFNSQYVQVPAETDLVGVGSYAVRDDDGYGSSWVVNGAGADVRTDFGVQAVFTPAQTTPVPEPTSALIPCLIGTGVAALCKKGKQVPVEQKA